MGWKDGVCEGEERKGGESEREVKGTGNGEKGGKEEKEKKGRDETSGRE